MRFWLICFALIFAGCTTPPVTVQPTLRGPIVPTRVIPTATDTLSASATPSPTLTFTPTDAPPTAADTATLPPSDTPAATIEVVIVSSATTAPTSTTVPSATATLIPSPTDTVETPSPTVTNTVETPSPTVTNTVETPTPTATDTVETPSPTPTDTPSPTATPLTTFEPFIFSSATSQEPVEIQGEVELNVPMHGTIDDQHPAVLYSFEGTAGMLIDVEMWAQTEELDPYLILLDPKGRELVRNDDADDVGNAALRAVILPEDGTYVIVATRYQQQFGESAGIFELDVIDGSDLVAGTFSELISYESSINDTLDDDTLERLYTFRATAGDVITIQMTTTDGDLDPNITLTDNIGTVLAYNDDNLLLDVLDSLIQGYIVPRSGYYAILAARYGSTENSGDYRLKVTRNGQNNSSRFALLNNPNSGFVSEEGTFLNVIGDVVDDEDGREHAYQGLLTFHLPPADAPTIENARFAIAPCVERGGWDTLGVMTIYEDNYGDIDTTRNVTRPLPGARILSTQTDCSPLDLTDIVQNAYETGDLDIQLRLMFRDRTNNGETDYVMITPSLLITFAE